MHQLPKILRDIDQEVHSAALPASNLAEYQANWRLYTQHAQELIPELVIADDGETMLLDACSPGCQACKQGMWDCIFLTMRCNLSCPFCYSPRGFLESKPESAYGASREQIAVSYAKTTIHGVGFTGGEPFQNPAVLLDWLVWARELLPAGYLWVYTNGTLVRPQTLKDLARLGLNEIRFNAAAAGYTDPKILNTLRCAVDCIPAVTVEIPAIPQESSKLLNSLSTWADAGVRYLNLHELLYEPGTPSEQLPGERLHLRLPDGHTTAVDPRSRDLVLSVMETVVQQKLNLPVNHCSLINKTRQVRGRRRSLLPLTQTAFEKLVVGDLLESYILYSDAEATLHCHPDQLENALSTHPGWQAARIARTAPLSIQDRGRWVVCELSQPVQRPV